MVAPMLNLPLVEQVAPSARPEQRCDLQSLPARTRHEWFVFNQSPLQVWHGAFKQVSDAKFSGRLGAVRYLRPLIDYLDDAIERGPVSPHFYNERGQWRFSGRKGAMASILLPFGLIDYNALMGKKIYLIGSLFSIFDLETERPILGLRIPFVKNRAGRYLVSRADGSRVVTTELNQDIKETLDGFELNPYWRVDVNYVCDQSSRPNRFAKEELLRELEGLRFNPNHGPFFLWNPGREMLGFERIGLLPSLGEGYVLYQPIPNDPQGAVEAHPYIPYMQGLYKMMLLMLGLNNDNRAITQEDGRLLEVKEGLQRLVADAGPDHPWNPRAFNKGNFLQYEITKVLLANEELLTRLKNVIDFNWNPWELYQDLKYNRRYYRANGTPYLQEEVEEFLPGDVQALAFMTTLAVRLLLYGACSRGARAFYKATGTFKLPGIMTFSGFKKSARNRVLVYPGNNKYTRLQVFVRPRLWFQRPERYSFLDVWGQVKEALFARWERKGWNRKHWISFDGHGWVASFDDRLLQLQRDQDGVDRGLLDELGVACIESWLGSELEAFYKV